MSLPLALRPEAQAEFDHAVDWYEERRVGLGAEFIEHVEQILKQICATPERFPRVFRDVRQAVVRRFPYAVYYKVEGSKIVVIAVFHGKRDPSIWRERT